MTHDRTPEACDLLIEAGWVVPVVPHGVVLEDHAVAVRNGEIVAVLPTREARARFNAAETVSRPDAALIPGLVNAHTHNSMTLLRGIADDLPLMTWLQQHVWPAEAPNDRSSSVASCGVAANPSRSAIVIGKNVTSTTTSTFGIRPKPNQTTTSGAIATIGIVCDPTSSG